MKYKTIDLNKEDKAYMVGSISFSIVSMLIFIGWQIGDYLHLTSILIFKIIIGAGFTYTWICILYTILFHTVIKKYRIRRFAKTEIPHLYNTRSALIKLYALGYMKPNYHMFLTYNAGWINKTTKNGIKGLVLKDTKGFRIFLEKFEDLGVNITKFFVEGSAGIVVIEDAGDANLIKLSLTKHKSKDNIFTTFEQGYIYYYDSNELLDRMKTNKKVWQNEDDFF